MKPVEQRSPEPGTEPPADPVDATPGLADAAEPSEETPSVCRPDYRAKRTGGPRRVAL